MKRFLLIFTLLSVLVSIHAQTTRTIRGKVTDATYGEPIIGANVLLKGTSVGTITNIDGEYSLSFSHNNPVLEFTYIGYEKQEFQIAPHMATLNVALHEDIKVLDEVVVVGYGVQKKSVLSASISTVHADAVKKSDKKGKTWKRSGMPENSIRLEVGDGEDDFLPLEAAQIAVQIDGFRVRVLMDCFFFNDKKDGLEGTFKLRLPTGATPYYFAFGETEYMDEEAYDEDVYEKLIDDDSKNIKPYGKQIPYVEYDSENFDLSPEEIEDMDSREWDDVKEARIVSKQKAARAYEETVSASIDPALMEWAGADFFSCRVFPLSRGKLHRIVIGYDLNMTEASDFREYILSLPAEAKELRVDADIYSPEEMKPEILPAVETTQQNDRLYISLHNPKKKEYKIQYNTVEPILLSDETNDYFAANYRITLPEIKQEQLPGDAIFLLDVSLSSQPDKFNVWLTLMEEILTQNRDVIKRFSVVCFNIETFWWNRAYQKNNYYNISRFLEYANTLALEGATDLGSALAEASKPSWLKENRPKHLFVMSDADFNWGESNLFALKNLLHQGDRIHTYKTGLSGTNVAVLDYLSKETGGFSFTVTGEEEAALTAKSFRYRPWQIEEIKMEGVDDFLISGQPSQLYNGQKLIFGGRGKPKGSIYIRVNNGIETKELNLHAGRQLASGLSKRIYGQLALSQLESFGFQTEEATESYATYFRIPNATMSFLMLESQWDYDRFGIDDDAEYFVEKNTVAAIIEELLKKELAPLGNGKNDFFAWLERLKNDTEIYFEADNRFFEYIDSLPDDIFTVKLIPYTYRVRLSEHQSYNEKEALENENLRYDKILPLANTRKSTYGKADALKLMSSVIERNAGDFIALRDIAIKAIEWGLGDQAYYMMRRIIANRQYEAVAYLTAAEALAKSNYTEMALIYYYICHNSDWDSDYGSFKEIAALQCLRLINDIEKTQNKSNDSFSAQTMRFASYFKTEIETYLDDNDLLIKEADIVIIINWNTNNTDVDLHVMEPTGEECYYGNSSTEIGGELTIDVTNGYGPEMYVLREAVNGEYSVSLSYFADDDTKTSSKSKVYIDFYRNWGRANEKHIRKTIELENRKDKDKILQFKVRKKKGENND